jgi:hypothetical protein
MDSKLITEEERRYAIELRERVKHIHSHRRACGICSNIPECCINFFISTNNIDLKVFEQYKKEVTNCGYKFAYVPCPECLKLGRVNKLKSCAEIAEEDCTNKEFRKNVIKS